MATRKVSQSHQPKKSDQPIDPLKAANASVRSMAKTVSKLERLQAERQKANKDKCQLEDLAVTVAAVLKNPACPDQLHSAITDALSEIETGADNPER